LRDDPQGTSIARDLERHAPDVRNLLPEYDPSRHALDLLQDWSRFRAFVLAGSLRVDLTD
jgi:hypothetical protein